MPPQSPIAGQECPRPWAVSLQVQPSDLNVLEEGRGSLPSQAASDDYLYPQE